MSSENQSLAFDLIKPGGQYTVLETGAVDVVGMKILKLRIERKSPRGNKHLGTILFPEFILPHHAVDVVRAFTRVRSGLSRLQRSQKKVYVRRRQRRGLFWKRLYL